MSKDPAFLFYSSDFLTGTMFLTDEQVGKYMRLLCAQHQNGPLTEEEMLNICVNKDEKIFKKFKKGNDGLFQNQRLTDEVNKRKKYSASRSKNIGKRWGKEGKPLSGKKLDNIHMKNICNTHVIHMENENEIENKDINKDINKDEDKNKNYIIAAEYFKEKLLKQSPRAKITDTQVKNWSNDFRLMITIDKRTNIELKSIIDAAFEDSFWRKILRSPGKLRAHLNDGKMDRLYKNRDNEEEINLDVHGNELPAL